VKIKICGLTRERDVAAAAALGVDAVGFVLWPGSPRAVTVERVRALIAHLPPFVTPVGVFVTPSPGELEAARDAGVMVAQVHGAPGALPPPGLAVLRAVSLAASGEGTAPAVPAGVAVLLDAWDPVRHGGTGTTVDWRAAARVAATRPVVLAGGLRADNVREAMAVVRPYGVDVSSGVEQAPGIKDHEQMAAFVAAVRAGA
jgi:phosphoribosylanthranilate isomerase